MEGPALAGPSLAGRRIRPRPGEPAERATELLQPESTSYTEASIPDYAERTQQTVADADADADADAVEAVEQKLATLQQQLDAHRELSIDLAYEDVSATA